MAHTVRTWVVVADGSHARILENAGKGEGLDEILSEEAPRTLTHDIVSDRQGRYRGEGGAGRHAMEPRTDPHRYNEHEFARHVCALLDRKAREGRFDRLILAAAPAMLGDLRAMLSERVRELIQAEIDKDYVHLSPRELVRRLTDVAKF